MFAIARAVARRPLPALCVVGLIGFLAFGQSPAEKPADPWGAAPPAVEAEASSQDSMLSKAVDTAADYAEKADSTGTVAKVRGTVETTASGLDNSANAVAKATGN
ncbi:hypothetical protein [Novosphingobium taihuense]|uniref:Uncharacterized protein n=1 Tax=Novosphingobium taihuense TaxID=260085 RepID=A0A7W7ABB9_9SPHN|nr:hypothetical protein [Novosphingobium taihuense]MBB4613716.1 hypothetical protein [Novosphingobium taihuense]TWH83225.1 hypothetical protein IQ25_02877 [Novosphingobium taihuense]